MNSDLNLMDQIKLVETLTFRYSAALREFKTARTEYFRLKELLNLDKDNRSAHYDFIDVEYRFNVIRSDIKSYGTMLRKEQIKLQNVLYNSYIPNLIEEENND